MKRYLKCFSFLITGIILQSCLTTYYGKAPKSIESEIVEFKVFWNYFCNESHVTEKFELKVNELMSKSKNYHAYLILYQSNNSLETGKRRYIIHFFENDEKKNQFIKMTDDKISELKSVIESESFRKQSTRLTFGQKLEDTFELFPELKNYYLRQDFEYESNMVYGLHNLKFFFNKNGRLMNWEN